MHWASQSTGLLTYSWKRQKVSSGIVNEIDNENIEAERMLIHIDDQSPNCLQDNILFYIGGFVVHSLLHEPECDKCTQELLLDPNDPGARNMTSYPIFAKFTAWKQFGGLILLSHAVLRIIKATEVVFKRLLIDMGKRNYNRKNDWLKNCRSKWWSLIKTICMNNAYCLSV